MKEIFEDTNANDNIFLGSGIETTVPEELEVVPVSKLLDIIDELVERIEYLELQLRIKELENKSAEMLIKYLESFK